MQVEVKVPRAGESVAEGDIARWFREDGDFVDADEPLCELETDKASLEITAEAAGRLTVDIPAGETVKVGQVIGRIDTAATPAEAESGTGKPSTGKADKPSAVADTPPKATDVEPPVTAAASAPSADSVEDEEDKAKLASVFNLMMPSPAARKLMVENRLSARDVKGTGRDGRITKADVLDYLDGLEREERMLQEKQEQARQQESKAVETADRAAEELARVKRQEAVPVALPAVAPQAAGPRQTRREKMSRIRKTIAQRLVKTGQEMAMLTTFNEVDMGAIMDIRARYKESFKEKHEVGLGFMSFFTRAVCRALSEFPAVNAQIDGEEIVYHDYCDIGIAVSTPRGLVVPVLRNAEGLGFQAIERAIIDLATRGRDGKLTLDELSNGTFTITNGGIFGSMLSTPLINHPQSAILGMHNIVQRPVAKDGAVVIRPVMYLALSYDHRIIDGAEAVRFLVRVKEMLEDPIRLMLEV